MPSGLITDQQGDVSGVWCSENTDYPVTLYTEACGGVQG